MKNEAKIFALRSRSSETYFQIIEIAFSILREKEYQSIVVEFHPVITIPDRSLLAKLIRRYRDKYYKKHKNDNNITVKDTLLHVLNNTGEIILKTKYGKITCIQKDRFFIPRIDKTIYYLYKSYVKNKQYKKEGVRGVAKFQYNGISYGLNILSHELRYNDHSNGRISSIKDICYGVFVSFAYINYINEIYKKGKAYEYVCIMEQYYRYGILIKSLVSKGAKKIDYDGFQGRLILQESKPDEFKKYYPEIESYIAKRIGNPELMLANKSFKYDLDTKRFIDKYPQATQNHNNVFVYLHSFVDAQYRHGYDGFEDLYEWTNFTIATLSRIKVNNVFVKDHPDGNRHIQHADVINLLMFNYQDVPNVYFIDPVFSIHTLKSLPNYIGITHHGTASEEHAMLNLPVIDSANSPRGDKYLFTHRWNSVDEYTSMLENIEHYLSIDIDNTNRELYRYIYDTYILNRAKQRIFINYKNHEKYITTEKYSMMLEKSQLLV
jgi:hypothetical protein